MKNNHQFIFLFIFVHLFIIGCAATGNNDNTNEIHFRIYESTSGTDGPSIAEINRRNMVPSAPLETNAAVDWSDVDLTDPAMEPSSVSAMVGSAADGRQEIPPGDPHPLGTHKHYTDNAIITHKDNEKSMSAVSRYPPYIDKDGNSVSGPPDKNKQQEGGEQQPPRAPIPPEPLLQAASNTNVGQVGGNQDSPMLVASQQQQQNAPQQQNAQQQQKQPPQQMQEPPQVITSNTINNSSGGHLSNLTTGLMALGKMLMGTIGVGLATANNQSANTTSSERGSYLVDDARCQNYTVQICHQKWMQKHCPDMCRGQTSQDNSTAAPSTTNVPTTTTTNGYQACCPCASLPCPCVPPPCPTTAAQTTTPTTAVPITTTTPVVGNVATVSEDPQCKLYSKETCNLPYMQLNCPQTCSGERQQRTPQPITTAPTPATSQSGCKTPTTNGGCCRFPFIHKNTPVDKCLPMGGQEASKSWCATTDNFDKDLQWGECATPTQTVNDRVATPPPKTPGIQSTTRPQTTLGQTTSQICCPCASLPCPCVPPPCPTNTPITTTAAPAGSVCDPWPVFGECSKTCGGGEQYRTRNCSISDGQNSTVVQQSQKHLCGMQPCPIDYTEWSAWGLCTNGKQWRNRTGTWEDLSYNISIPYLESQPCPPQNCTSTSDWSDWTECSKTCESGQQHRIRNCTDGSQEVANQTCNTQPCNEECGDWSAFSQCSKTCGGGQTTRWRTCGGSIVEEKVPCNEEACPSVPENPDYDCADWIEWSACSATCNGMQSRYRHCKNHSAEFDEMQTRPCNTNPCPGTNVTSTTTTATPTTNEITTPTTTPTTTAVTPIIPVIPFEECLVTYLSFDVVDTKKKTVFDEGPFSNHFTYNGDVEFVAANFSCQNAASIDADGDLYYAGAEFANSPNMGVTIALWVHPTDLMHKQSIFSSKSVGSKGANLQLDLEVGKVRWLYNDLSGENNFTVVTNAVVATDEWVHIAATYNASTKEARVFINAKEMGVLNNIENASSLLPWNMFVALFPPVYENKFKGLIDEFYVFNCSLTVEQIRVIADTCRDEGGNVCPSPLLGVCPPCEHCNNATTTTPAPQPSSNISTTVSPQLPLNSNTSFSGNNTSGNDSISEMTGGATGGLPGKETDPGPFENYQGPENKESSAPPIPKLNEENKGQDKGDLLPSNLPKNWQPKHLKAKQM